METSMEQTEKITCPCCGHEQDDDIHDLVETGDMEGAFGYECQKCCEYFIVEFEFIPMVGTSEWMI